jgi:hypothetical protein
VVYQSERHERGVAVIDSEGAPKIDLWSEEGATSQIVNCQSFGTVHLLCFLRCFLENLGEEIA